MYDINSSHVIMVDAWWDAHKQGKAERWMAYACWWFYRQQVMNHPDYWSKMASHLTETLDEAEKTGLIDQLNGGERKIISATMEAPEMPIDLLHQLQANLEPMVRDFDLVTSQAASVKKIDDEAEAYRLNFITKGSGQAMTYLLKEEQALMVVENNNIDPALVGLVVIDTEVDPSLSLVQAAEVILGQRAQWAAVGEVVERKRRMAKKAVSEATTKEEIDSAANVVWTA